MNARRRKTWYYLYAVCCGILAMSGAALVLWAVATAAHLLGK